MGVGSHQQDKEEGLKDLCRMMVDDRKVTGNTALTQCNTINDIKNVNYHWSDMYSILLSKSILCIKIGK